MFLNLFPFRLSSVSYAANLAVLVSLCAAGSAYAQLCTGTSPPCVLTSGYAGPVTDANFNSRQGMNPYETTLSPTSLPSSTTYSLFLQVDTGDLPTNAVSNPVMAQPLYVTGITISSPAQGTCNPCNMVIAVTLNGTVYAWNADGTGAGNLLWSRHGSAGANTHGGNALWYDDCTLTGGPMVQGDILQFEGALATPVIDPTGTTPVMFLTSACQASAGAGEWWIHEIDLTTGKDVSIAGVAQRRRIGSAAGDFPGITEKWQQQRPALLQVRNSNNSSTSNLIYILFGTNVTESDPAKNYVGWVVAYQNTSTGLTPKFAYSSQPTSCGTGGGTSQCTGNSGTPGCDCYVTLADAPNWGGHGGGCWMSGNGPAATTLGAINSDGAVHVLFGCGNGGFQEFKGSTPSSSNNNGQAIMDFRLTSSGYDYTNPFQVFTPDSPASGVAPPAADACQCSGGTCQPCPYTFQTMNARDYDMSTSGVTLFNDLAGTQRAVTVDKAGYGYLVQQGNLCGSGTFDATCVGFSAGDPGSWTFGASQGLCNSGPDLCDRVTSFSLSDTKGPASSRKVYLHYWPFNERLTGLLLSDNSTLQSGTGTLATGADPNSLYLSGCTADVNCLPDQVIVGDSLSLSSCSCQGASCPPVVTSVSAITVKLNVTVASAFPSCSFPQSFQYKGFFVTPAHDSTPAVSAGGYPGAALNSSSNCTGTTCTHTIIWAVLPDSNSSASGYQRGLGTLYGYSALPNANDAFVDEWSSTDIWCASSFARPTIVNASIFVPTYMVSNGTFSGTCPVPGATGQPFPSGILVYR